MRTPGFTILVADDNTVLLEGLERALSSHGYAVRTAASGAAVLELLERASAPPDLLLLDIMMPDTSGLEVLQAVIRDPRWSELPVILITAATDGLLPATALRGGAVDFLPKPFRLGELIARIEAHIQRSKELARARAESRSRARAAEVVRELNSVAEPGELLRLVTERLAGLWAGSRCSIVVNGARGGRVIASSAGGDPEGRQLAPSEYPEIRAAFEAGAPLLVENTETSPLFDELRREWEQQGLAFPITSAAVVPLGAGERAGGALLLRAQRGYPPLNQEALATAVAITNGLIHSLGQARFFELLRQQPHYPDPPASPSAGPGS